MTAPSPLTDVLKGRGAATAPYGPPERPIEVVMGLDAPAIEYGAIRKGVALLDQPNRGVIEVAGADRFEFLGRMVTQDLRGLEPGTCRRSFWLNRKGRIEADMRLISLEERLVIDLDAHAAPSSVAQLGAFVFTEDVTLTDRSGELHRIGLHGPRAPEVLAALAEPGDAERVRTLAVDRAVEVTLAGFACLVERSDLTGSVGLELTLAPDAAVALARLILPQEDAEHTPGSNPPRAIGWHAFNAARIEHGEALFNVDFGPDSLPAETSLLDTRVSFTKGCYLGQEVVARMQSLGHPKRKLVGVRLGGDDAGAAHPDVATGDVLRAGETPDAPEVGAITSASIGPMLGGALIGFAMVKWGQHEAGTRLWAHTGAGPVVEATVQASLRFWSPGE